jgi:galactitol-specific phosphotransferase system IIC component
MSKLFTSLEYAPYLKMLNPTTKVWHMEGVSPECKTVKDAIKERFGGRDMKIIAAA